MSIEDMVRAAPKAELHLHIEGTMEPSLLFKLSQRNNIPLPFSLEEAQKLRQNFANLQEFLDQYYYACKVLITSQDFYELAMEYFEKAISSNISHCEVFFDPQTHLDREVAFETFFNAFLRAAEEVKDRLSVQWIMCFLRHLSAEEAMKVLDVAQPFASKIMGVGLDSSEEGNPPKKFEEVYRVAGEKGFCGEGCLKVAHAGEECDATSVIGALYYLKPLRIDHGVRSIDSTGLCKFLKDSQIPLTVCPLSNKKLNVKERFFSQRKIIRELSDLGILVTINSDDPAFFGGYLCENYLYALEEFEGQDKKEVLRTLCKNSFKASFISEEQKQKYCAEVDRVLERFS